MLFRIRVVNERGSIPGLKQAALRELVCKPFLAILVPLLFAAILLPPFGGGGMPSGGVDWQWHDKIAGTHVVKVGRKP
jgi:hypothetical protein